MENCLHGLKSRGFAPRHIMDIGASHGPWTSTALTQWPASRYTLFEPLREHAETLNNLRATHPGITWFPLALGSRKTDLPISVYPDHLDAASLAYGGPGSRKVTVERLDDLLSDGRTTPADFIKIDVQGFEFEVLKGAQKMIDQTQVMIIETYFFRFAPGMSLFHEMIEHMHSQGFRVYEVFDLIRRPFDQAVGQCDICFVREGHPLIASSAWR